MHAEDNLDNLMEQGLASYAGEPSVDLASRILMEARVAPVISATRRYKFWAGAGIGIAAAGLLALLLMHDDAKVTGQKQLASQTVSASAPRSFDSRETVRVVAIARSQHRRGFQNSWPRVASATYVPPPITEQERLLLTLATHYPKQALELVAMQEQDAEPLKVEPLHSAPLKIEPMAKAPLEVTPLNIEPLAEPRSE